MSDAATLSIWDALLSSVAEEMGVTLGPTAHSPNIKERRDFCCEFLRPRGGSPLPGGPYPCSSRRNAVVHSRRPGAGAFNPVTTSSFNDPYLGGTHLPDVSLISPIFSGRRILGLGRQPSDITPTSVGCHRARCRLQPSYIRKGSSSRLSVFTTPAGSTPESTTCCGERSRPGARRGISTVQIAANKTGELRFHSLIDRYAPTS